MGLALATLAGVTLLVALVSEIFVESVQQAAQDLGMTPAFVGFIVVALVGGAAEMASAFSGARKSRLDLSVGIALGSASQDRGLVPSAPYFRRSQTGEIQYGVSECSPTSAGDRSIWEYLRSS